MTKKDMWIGMAYKKLDDADDPQVTPAARIAYLRMAARCFRDAEEISRARVVERLIAREVGPRARETHSANHVK